MDLDQPWPCYEYDASGSAKEIGYVDLRGTTGFTFENYSGHYNLNVFAWIDGAPFGITAAPVSRQEATRLAKDLLEQIMA